MIKTIATVTQNTPNFPPGDDIVDQCATWQTEGKYTGEVNTTHNVETGFRHVERWAWIDNDAAEAYKNLVLSVWMGYPDLTVNIVVE